MKYRIIEINNKGDIRYYVQWKYKYWPLWFTHEYSYSNSPYATLREAESKVELFLKGHKKVVVKKYTTDETQT